MLLIEKLRRDVGWPVRVPGNGSMLSGLGEPRGHANAAAFPIRWGKSQQSCSARNVDLNMHGGHTADGGKSSQP